MPVWEMHPVGSKPAGVLASWVVASCPCRGRMGPPVPSFEAKLVIQALPFGRADAPSRKGLGSQEGDSSMARTSQRLRSTLHPSWHSSLHAAVHNAVKYTGT
eukprot:366478-Chlamydomonas_euryale.AAC.8